MTQIFSLESTGPSAFRTHTNERYWNQIGPFGGWLAGLAMAAMRRHVPTDWAPRSIAVNFLGALPVGDVEIAVSVLRRQRRVAGLRAELRAMDDVAAAVVADAVFGVSRPSPHRAHLPAPDLPDPHTLPRLSRLDPLAAFVRAFDYRVAFGEPFRGSAEPRSGGWVRPTGEPAGEVGPDMLLMLADAWFPPGWATRSEPVPVSTISMQVVFHDVAPTTAGDGFLAACHREEAHADGFGLERGELWWPDGRLALTSQQLTWVGAPSASRP